MNDRDEKDGLPELNDDGLSGLRVDKIVAD